MGQSLVVHYLDFSTEFSLCLDASQESGELCRLFPHLSHEAIDAARAPTCLRARRLLWTDEACTTTRNLRVELPRCAGRCRAGGWSKCVGDV